jgi:hypothetical protein
VGVAGRGSGLVILVIVLYVLFQDVLRLVLVITIITLELFLALLLTKEGLSFFLASVLVVSREAEAGHRAQGGPRRARSGNRRALKRAGGRQAPRELRQRLPGGAAARCERAGHARSVPVCRFYNFHHICGSFSQIAGGEGNVNLHCTMGI